DHIRRVLPLTRDVLARAGCRLADIDAVAYTAGPGLAGALLVGAAVARGLAWSLDVPAIGIHHLEGHLLAPLMEKPAPEFPFVALLVSGGHTQLMRVSGVGRYELLGETLDDAAGEAFDKTAQLLEIGYPGGPQIARLATRGKAGRVKLPRPMLHSDDLDFSFSGLKTAVMLQVRDRGLDEAAKADVAAEFQAAIVDVLVAKSTAAIQRSGLSRLVVAGGVGANILLREKLNAAASREGFEVFYPAPEFCTQIAITRGANAGQVRRCCRPQAAPAGGAAKIAGRRKQVFDPPENGVAAQRIDAVVVAVEFRRAGYAQALAEPRKNEFVFVVGQADARCGIGIRHRYRQ
ncbi:MAG: tRNA (adenosine(37)-N6)-threonylcarbamoyltransferase complex transferase subunit TsaD, partial [Betaproteobacteria bacterium]|nr:tRNA (adenosine(37)-N6)-threonylcarbamoyltransferase complex transferase subunit TsaD [Betaproteobacteria bacterium]